jgi:hypothetical protein
VWGPLSQSTRRIASSPSVGRRGLEAIRKLLTKFFVTVNENFRQLPQPRPPADNKSSSRESLDADAA